MSTTKYEIKPLDWFVDRSGATVAQSTLLTYRINVDLSIDYGWPIRWLADGATVAECQAICEEHWRRTLMHHLEARISPDGLPL